MKGLVLRAFVVLVLSTAIAALGYIWIARVRDESHISSEEKKNLAAVLKNNGITADEKIEWPATRAYALYTRRDESAEAALALSLLGGCKAENLQGGIIDYSNSKGVIRFRQGGLIEAVYSGEPSDLQSAAAVMGLRNAVLSGDRLELVFDGIPVINAGIQLDTDGDMVRLQGAWILSEPLALRKTLSKSAAACILAYLGDEEPVFSFVRQVELVYYLLPSEYRVIPVWMLTTDIGPVLLDALTGKQI